MFDPTQCESVSMAQAKAQEEQNPVNAALRATSIAFVALAESGQIDDTTATENVSQFASWAYPVAYAVGNIRQYNGELFRCVQAHTSQADWTPDATASLWKKSAIRRKNGRHGPSRSAHMTPTTAATKCPTTGNTGHLTSTRTSGNLAFMAGQR